MLAVHRRATAASLHDSSSVGGGGNTLCLRAIRASAALDERILNGTHEASYRGDFALLKGGREHTSPGSRHEPVCQPSEVGPVDQLQETPHPAKEGAVMAEAKTTREGCEKGTMRLTSQDEEG